MTGKHLMNTWQTTRFSIDLGRTKLMGIVNVTPDSFSDGGQFLDTGRALRLCERLIQEGADILDIGGESSRPGAPSLPVEDEWSRVSGVLKAAVSLNVPVSVDTCKTEIMRRALELSASSLILVHNHPSGDPTPSQPDIDMTRQIAEAGRALRITLHDHLVVGRDGVASFKALGLM